MKKYGLLLLVSLLTAGCSSTPDDPYADPRDPFEDFNRGMWEFNRDVDKAVLKPAAETYEYIPQPIRTSLYQAVENLEEPSSFVNNLLQWKVADAGISLGRFVVNSTVGLVGLFDVATPMGLTKREESFGQTLAVWGVPEGPYLMLPLMGPTVVVDRGGDYADGQYFPYPLLSWPLDVARYAIKGLEMRLRLRQQERVLENSLDPYSFVKDVYYQRWQDQVFDGNPPLEDEDFDDWDEDWDGDDEFDELDDSDDSGDESY